MISPATLYHVVKAMVPLYAAMGLGYMSFRRGVFSLEQCAGINHFVALFAVPLLIFRMIASNDPYAMNLRFIAADAIHKVVVLVALAAWARLSAKGSLAWVITLFSLAALPNTIIMGVPVLGGMYGPMSESLMVQIVVLQFGFWYVFVLFLFEYMAAKNKLFELHASAVSSVVVPVADDGEQAVVEINIDDCVDEEPAAALKMSMRVILVMAAKKILKNPSTHASIVGLVWSFIAFRLGIKLPDIIDNSLLVISQSAIGLAMFSIGTFMARQKKIISCGYSVSILAMVMKFIVGPATMASSSLAVGLHADLLRTGIVQAALPIAVSSFVYAEEYHVHPEIMSTAIIAGIFISVPVTIIYYVLLAAVLAVQDLDNWNPEH